MSRQAALLLALGLLGCAGHKQRELNQPIDTARGWSQRGLASWYGPGFHGRLTANGEVYDMEAQTAAHRELPFGSRVEVIDLQTGRRTRVRINDRGPFVDGRVIDLSRAAARELDLLQRGVTEVELRLLSTLPAQATAAAASWRVQAGAFKQLENAQRLRERLVVSYPEASIESQHQLHRVVVAQRLPESQARELVGRLLGQGIAALALREPDAP